VGGPAVVNQDDIVIGLHNRLGDYEALASNSLNLSTGFNGGYTDAAGYQNPGGTALGLFHDVYQFGTGTQVAHSENTLLSVTARKGPGVGSMAWAALRFLSRTRSEQRQCGFADSVITSIRTLAAASAEAADSPQLQHDLPILTKWLSVRLGQIGLAQLVQRPWARHRFLSTRA